MFFYKFDFDCSFSQDSRLTNKLHQVQGIENKERSKILSDAYHWSGSTKYKERRNKKTSDLV